MMDPLDALLAELERFGKANDGSTTERPRRMLNITRDTGEFLAVLVRATLARRGLEIGTSHGYSTLWLAGGIPGVGGGVDPGGVSGHKNRVPQAALPPAGPGPHNLPRYDRPG